MAGTLETKDVSIQSSNEGSIVTVTVTNNNTTGAITNIAVTAIYEGQSAPQTNYIWYQPIATLAAAASVSFDLSIAGEVYNPTYMHVGLAFTELA